MCTVVVLLYGLPQLGRQSRTCRQGVTAGNYVISHLYFAYGCCCICLLRPANLNLEQGYLEFLDIPALE